MVKNIIAELLHVVYPKLCLGCKQSLLRTNDLLCANCHKYLPLTGLYFAGNATEKLFAGRVNILAASSLFYFQKDGIVQNVIHALKYEGNTYAGVLLGNQMAMHITAANWPLQNAVLVPVPLTAKRLQQRGYNQSLILAQAMSDQLHIGISNDIIYRTRETDTQTSKTRLERLQNMTGAFEIKNANSFENKHVIIIDDVVTSGATLEACVLAFKNVANINISILCAAIASEN